MSIQFCFIIFAFLINLVLCDEYLTEKPSFIISCKIHDTALNKCLAHNFQAILVQWKDGLPGLRSLGKLDPFLVNHVKIIQDGTRALTLNMELQNLLVTGVSTLKFQDIRLNTNTWILEGEIFVPKLIFDSDYKVKGNVLAFLLNSAGKAKFQSERVKANFIIATKLRDDGDLTFTEIKSLKAVIKEVGSFHMHVDNLFNGQKELEDAANTLFNENWRDLYVSMKPAIEQTIQKVLEDRFQKIFHYVPANYLISDIPKAAEVYG